VGLRTASTSYVWDALPRRMGSMSSGIALVGFVIGVVWGLGQSRVVGSGWGLFTGG
jgi:hypothetical protein